MTAKAEFGTVGFYRQMGDALNADPEWTDKGKAITCTMAYVYGPPVSRSFFLQFDEGRVVKVEDITDQGEPAADFVITASTDDWKAVLRREVKATTAMATGRLKVKGKQTYLLKNMAAFSYILDVMTQLDPVYE